MIGSGAGPNNCANDWLLVPCATNVGRIQPAQALCTDRICGGTFSAELSMQAATVMSKIIGIFILFWLAFFLMSIILHISSYTFKWLNNISVTSLPATNGSYKISVSN